MATRRKNLTGGEVADLGAVISEVAQGSEALEMRLQKVLQSGKRMSRGLQSELRKVHQRMIADARTQESTLTRLQRQLARGENVSENRIANLQNEIKNRRQQIRILDRVNQSTARENSLLGNIADRMKTLISIGGIFKTIWDVLVKAFENWIDLSQKMTRAMGQIAQATGATTSQFHQLQGVVGNMSGVFGSLEGPVDGIELAGEFTRDLATAWREVDEITPQFARSILEVSRGLGLGVEKTVALRRNLMALGIVDSDDDFRAFTGRIMDFSEAIGANAAQMMSDWSDSASFLSQFGNQAESTFKDAALMATQFGFETRKIFEIAKNFDTFGDASQKVNRLNAVLGTTISSYELMIEQDPARRVEMLTQALDDQGLEWDNLNRIQRMTLAQSIGLNEEDAARVFERGETLEEIEQAREAAAEQERRDARTQRQNQQLMNSLLQRTATVFETIERAFQRVWNALSRLLAPIFEVINTEIIALIDHFRTWIEGAEGTAEISTMIEDVSGWIKEAFHWLREHIPTWEELKEGVRDAWQTGKVWGEKVWEVGKKVKDVLVEVYDWLAKQNEEWDSGQSEVRQYWELMEAGASVVLRTFEDIGRAIDVLWEPFEKLVGLMTDMAGLDSEGGTLDLLTRSLNFLGGRGFSNEAADAQARTQERNNINERREEVIQTIRRRVGQGASLDQVTRELMAAGRDDPTLYRVSRSGQRFNEFIASEFERVPQSERGVVAPAAPSAVESSPTVAQTAASNVGRVESPGGRVLEIIASDVNIDGRTVGRILFEVRERSG